MREFKVYKIGGSIVLAVASGGFLLIGLLVWLIGLLAPETFDAGPPALWFTLLWCGVSIGILVSALRVPRSIQWFEDGSIVFKAPLRSVRLRAQDISRLRPGTNVIILEHSSGTLALERYYNGFHEFVSLLKQYNPEVVIEGI